MKRHKVLLIVLGVLALSLAHRAAAQPVRPDTMYAESHALLVGVSDYTNGWPDLSGVTQDIQAVRQALADLGFTVTVVMDPADKSEMDRAFSQFISAYGAQLDNRLLIYFAGHGKTITLADGREMGYIVPANAPLPARNQQGFIDTAMDMEQIQVYAKRIQAKHALFLFDSCFSGSIFSLGRGDPDRVIMDKANRPVRQFITSGSADEEVPDQSIFRRQFLAALRGEADIIPDGGDAAYVTGEELCAFLSHTVVDYSNGTQHPQCGKLRDPNLDKGDFVFVLPKAARPTPTPGALPEQGEFVLDDLELRNQWRQYQQKVEQAYSQVEAYEQQALHTQDKREAWQRFLDYAQQDNPYSERDDELRRQAQERLYYWQNFREPTPTPPVVQHPLRSQPGTYSWDEIEQMVKAKGLREYMWNPQGDFPNEYESKTLNGDKVVIDHASGLMWQQGGSPDDMSWSKAQGYIDELNRNRFAGFSDWCLPTIEELASLLEPTKKNDDLYIDPKFDTRQRWCWSSDKRSSESAWLVRFLSGSVYSYGVLSDLYVRAVRSWP